MVKNIQNGIKSLLFGNLSNFEANLNCFRAWENAKIIFAFWKRPESTQNTKFDLRIQYGNLRRRQTKNMAFWGVDGDSQMVNNTKNIVFHPEHHIPWVYKVFKNHKKSKKSFKTHFKKRKNAILYYFEPFSNQNQFFEKLCFWKFYIFCLPCKSPSSECVLHKKMLIFRHFWNFQVLQCKILVWTGPETSSDPFSNF